ncbi:MAG: hypothetical protein H6Q75_515 [Firmicutes bacterium]|nr:hypothetical protein [Bacillota bacterium]
MDTPKIQAYGELFAKKCKAVWDDLSEDLKWAKDVTEIRLQTELLSRQEERLFKEYGKAVYQSGVAKGPAVDDLLIEIATIEKQLETNYQALEKLKSPF